MTPTILKAETRIFGLVCTEWYCIHSLKEGPDSCRVRKNKAEQIIQAFGLTLAYKDAYGEIYAGDEGCFSRWLALKEIAKGLTKRQAAELLQEEEKKIHNFLERW